MNIKDENYLEDTIKKEVEKNGGANLSKKKKEALMQEAKVTVDFLTKVDEVELPKDNYVIFTDGNEQLYYENGEFYIISTTNGLKKKVKKTKKEATDMYLDYFIKYQLNPILDARGESTKVERNVPKKQLEDKSIEVEAKEEVKQEIVPEIEEEQKNVQEKEKKFEMDDREI